MAVSSESPYAGGAATVATMGNVTDSTHSTAPTGPTTVPNGHPDRDSDSNMALKEKINGLTNGHKRAAMAGPKLVLDTSGSSVDGNNVNEADDFVGDVNTNNEIPGQELLKSVEDMRLFDKECKPVSFKSLYSGPNVARRVLIIFIRHFFCGVRPSLTLDRLPQTPNLLLPSNTRTDPQTELPRISPHSRCLHHPRRAPPPPHTHLHRHSWPRRTFPDSHVRRCDPLSLPHLR